MKDKTLYDYWMVCYRRKVTIFVMIVTAVVGAVVIGASLPSIYEARAMFYVPASATTSRSNTGVADIPLPTSNQDDAKANIGILKGRDSLRAIQAQFPQKSMDALQRNVDFTAGRDGIIHIYVRDKDPVLAANIANAYYTHFNRFLLERMQQRSTFRIETLKQRLADVTKQMSDLLAERNKLAALTGSPSLESEALELLRERGGMYKELDELHGEIGARVAAESRGERTRPSATPAIDELERQIAQIDVELAKIQLRTLPNHPDQIALLKSREAAQAALQQKLASLSAGEKTHAKTIAGMVNKREQRLNSIRQYQNNLRDMDQNYRDLREAQTFLKNSLEEATLAGLKAAQIGIVIETAQPPEVPVFPITWLNIVIAAIVSILSGMLYALFLDYIDERAISMRKQAPQQAPQPQAG